MLVEETKTLLTDVVTHLPELWAQRSDSMVEFTNPTRNDFLTLVEYPLVSYQALPDILDRVQTLVSGYYLSSVSLLVDIPGIEVRKTLGKLSTRRDPIESILGSGSAVAKRVIGTESYEHGLPFYSAEAARPALETFALEDLNDDKFKYQKQRDANTDARADRNEKQRRRETGARYKADQDKFNHQKANDAAKLELEKEKMGKVKDERGVSFGKSIATVDELSNLSTGKQLEVVMERNGNRATIPVQIRLAVTDTDSESMATILSHPAGKSFGERFKKVRNKELHAVKDLIFCHDLLAESRKARIRDKSGFYEHMMRRLSKNFLSGLFSMSPSINNASAVIVCTEETAKRASLELGGPLSKFHIRQQIFEATATMLIVVVDTKWDTVDIYHRGTDSYTTLTSRDLKRSGKGGGGNQVTDIIAAYQAGSAPTY